MGRIAKEIPAHEIAYYQLDQIGGCYNFRPVRGGSKLSMHAYGAAIDLAPQLNPMGATYDHRPHVRMMPEKVIKIFTDEMWAWGGQFSRPDSMHFEGVNRGA